ncbi:MAG: hypothetical protein ACI841_001239 [Planctomycetota bacterium]|jgi:hypothetical protein
MLATFLLQSIHTGQSVLSSGPARCLMLVGALLGAPTFAQAQEVGFALRRSGTWEDGGQTSVRIELSAPAPVAIDVSFTISGNATSVVDYSMPASPVQIPIGASHFELLIDPVADVDVEGPETIEIEITSLSSGTLNAAMRRHRLTLRDDDRPTWNPGMHGLFALPDQLSFPAMRVGETSVPQTIQLRNRNDGPVSFENARREGEAGAELQLSYASSLPILLGAGAQTSLDVSFQPTQAGPRNAELVVSQFPLAFAPTRIAIDGVVYGPLGAEVVINAFQLPYTDGSSQEWIPDYGTTGQSITVAAGGPVANTTEDGLYRTARAGQDFGYSFELPNGTYDLNFHFAEIAWAQPGLREFDVRVEGVTIVDDLDLLASFGAFTAHQELTRIELTDGVLDIELEASVGEAILAALEIRAVTVVNATPTAIDFLVVEQGQFDTQSITLTNPGLIDANIDTLEFDLTGQGSSLDFGLDIGGTQYWGDNSSISHPVSQLVPAGGQVVLPLTFQPTNHRDNQFTLRFAGNFGTTEVSVAGLGGAGGGWGYLHPFILVQPSFLVDYDGNGSETLDLIGSASHTHEPGHTIVGWEWFENGLSIATLEDTTLIASTGDTQVQLTISDDNVPAITATESATITVFEPTAVGGIVAQFFDAGLDSPAALLDTLPTSASFAARVTSLTMGNNGGMIGPAPYSTNTLVQLQAEFDVAALDDYVFTVAGGNDSRLFVDGQQLNGAGSLPLQLAPGNFTLEARFAVDDVFDLPLSISISIGGNASPDFADNLYYDATQLLPVLYDVEANGTHLGGDTVSLNGFGFHPEVGVIVEWGAVNFTAEHALSGFLSYSDGLIQIETPPGIVALANGQNQGVIQVRVTTPAGSSASFDFEYIDSGPVPVQFDMANDRSVPVAQATSGAWGPDGRLYVSSRGGDITAITYGDNYYTTDVTTYSGVSSLTNAEVLGVAFSPFDAPLPVKIYVAHGLLYDYGGNPPTGPSDYTGQVSVLTGPNFDAPVPLITGLPVSNHDHGINGLEFDHNGDLLICVGGNTNAGVRHYLIGDRPESPFSSAILKAHLSRPGFNGAISYRNRSDDLDNNDQNFGDLVYVTPGVDIDVHAAGFRNTYDLVLATNGFLYATDNGPNSGFGFASTGPSSDSGSHPDTNNDELLLIERGNFYGHANRSRGVDDPRQNIYYGESPDSIPETFTQWIGLHQSSSNGICEYRATTFDGAMRGNLLSQRFAGKVKRHILSQDGRGIISGFENLPQMIALDVVTGPGGVILPISYLSNAVKLMLPDDSSVIGPTAYDITPWRGVLGGGTRFVIGGENFGTLANTSVTIDGQAATLSYVSSNRIIGTTPAGSAVTGQLVDVNVTVDGWSRVLPEAFMYLPDVPGQWFGRWRTAPDLSTAVEEVTACVIDGQLIVVGHGTNQTQAFDLLAGTWSTSLAARPISGGHSTSQVSGGKLYVIGGSGAAAGKVQIYDPVANSWSLGMDAPRAIWGATSCTIDGAIYVAAAVVGAATARNTYRYDPLLNNWTSLKRIPDTTKVDHAAGATDGERFFIFGGRVGDGTAAPGETFVQIYDPQTDSWETSELVGSSLTPMPAGRGGTGRAIFDRGEFYIFGGETSDADNDIDATADKVFAQVQVYDPVANTWRNETEMLTARHGHSPVLFQSRILLAGGATENGSAATTLMEEFSRQ